MDDQTVGNRSTPAGWFANPAGTMRWWDGNSWTDQVSPGCAVPVIAPASAASTSSRPGVNAFAILALLLGFAPYFGVLAILAGVTALDRIKQTGERGRILAIIGITFGALWGLDLLLLIFK